ncbi:MAG: hypothetical protein C5S38_06945 [Candidatus Methanophagaceae archaeon]|nr:MAG: hypothetical protein C5S38_06945 [Methanophagales archaeon]
MLFLTILLFDESGRLAADVNRIPFQPLKLILLFVMKLLEEAHNAIPQPPLSIPLFEQSLFDMVLLFEFRRLMPSHLLFEEQLLFDMLLLFE